MFVSCPNMLLAATGTIDETRPRELRQIMCIIGALLS